MEEKSKNIKTIRLIEIFKKIGSRKRLFFFVTPVCFILACIYIFSFPRYYITETKLAPEIENSLGKGSLGSIASSLGFDIGEMQTTDAITPLLYPDLMEDNGFIASLYSIQVADTSGEINTNLYDYIYRHQKGPWWSMLFKSEKEFVDLSTIDAYNLTKKEDEVATAIKESISIHVNSKSGVISISAQAQDPLICKTLADSVRQKLQAYITKYRTNKARTDWEYYKNLTEEARHDYELACQHYARMADANTNVSLKSMSLKLDDLENDMQIKFNTYTTLNNQLQAAKAKVQERTPAFTILKGAALPVKPAGPKRMIFVAVMTLLSIFATSMWILRKDISSIFIQ